MTDVQILTLALAVIVPISLLLLNNSRISDLRGSFQTALMDTKDTLRAEMKSQHSDLAARITSMDSFLREAVMGKLDELDRRLTSLEGRR